MTSRKGGYIIIDLTSTTLVDDLAIALKSNKPVLVYNADDEANYFTLSYDSDSETYTLTGAKNSYTVDDDGDITPVVPIVPKKYYYHNILLDKNDVYLMIVLISSKSTALTFAELYEICRVDIAGQVAWLIDGENEYTGVIVGTENKISFKALPGGTETLYDNTSTITDTATEI